MAHSRFSPSATERDTLCAPSFLLNEQMPDRSSPDAEHGTAAHHLGETCLKTDHDTSLYAGCTIAVTPDTGHTRFVHEEAPLQDHEHAFEVDDEMVAAVQSYVDWVREVPGDSYVEIKVEHTPWCPDFDEWGDPLPPQYGTADSIVIDAPRKTITVTDLKYGKGVRVYADHNKQATKYALGAVLEYEWLYDIDDSWTVVIRIAQPRLDHFDVWTVPLVELRAFGEQIKRELTEVFNPDAPFNPGEKQCKFCKVSARCKAKHEHIHAQVALAFDDEDRLPDPRLLSTDELVQAWKLHPLFEDHYKAINTELLATLKAGEEHPEVKLVAAVTHRRWLDEINAKAALRKLGLSQDMIEKKKIISPNQAEKLLTKDKHEQLKDHWQKPAGGPVIALATDKRDAYTGNDTDVGFDDEDDDGL